MPAPVVTQLIVDSSGAKLGVAEFEALMARAKAAAVDGGNATAQSFEAAQRRWVQSLGATDPVIRAQIKMKDDLAKQEAVNSKAVQLGIATTDAAKAQMDAVRSKHEGLIQTIREQTGQLTTNEKAWQGLKNATSGVSGQLIALSAGAGPAGVFLSALGPWGVAAAVGLGGAGAALSFVSDKTHELAQKGKEIKELSEAIGFTTMEFQATRSEMGKFGIDSETMASGIAKFTAGFAELRDGQGALLINIRRIDPALADQMQRTTDAATAFTLFGKAVAETDNIFQRNQLLKAGMGRGSAIFGAFFESKPDIAGLTASFVAAGKGIDDNLIKKLAQLEIDINKTRSAANTVFASMFGTSTLEGELQFAQGMLKIATYAKEFKLSDDLRRLFDVLTHPAFLAALGLLAAVPLLAGGLTVGTGALAVGGAGLIAGAAVGGVTRMGANDNGPTRINVPASPSNFVSPANSYSTFQKVDDVATANQKTIQADANAWKEYIAVIGSAATPQERLSAAISELTVKAIAAGRGGDQLAKGIKALKFDDEISQQSAHNAALGASVPITDLVIAKGQQLQKLQQEGANLTPQQIAFQKQLTAAQALGTYQIKSQIDAEDVRQHTIGMSVGAAAAYTAEQTRLNKAVQDRQVLTPKELKDLHDTSTALGVKAQASAQASAQSKADFDVQTMFLSDTEKSIAQVQFQLRGDAWRSFMNDGLSASLRLASSLKDLQGYTTGFTTDLARGLEQGKSLLDSVSAAAVNLGAKLIDAGLTSAINIGLNAITGASGSGSALGGAAGGVALTAGATAAGATLIAAATTAAGILAGAGLGAGTGVSLGAADASLLLDFSAADAATTLGIGGATAGTALDLSAAAAGTSLAAGGVAAGLGIWGPIAAIAAILIGIGLMSAGGEDKVKKAKQTWVDAGPAFQKFLTEMSGGVQGDLVQRIQDASSREAAFEKQAWDARDTAAVNAARAGLQTFSDTQKRLFQATFQATVDALNDGLGLDSPFMKAVNNVKTALNNQLAFIDDTNVAIGNNIPGTMARAKAASQTYLLSLLQQPQALSAVQTGMLQIHGTANALQGALVQLGLSSTDAATAINAGVSKAIADLKKQFEGGLTERLNVANGQSFLNDATKLIQQHQQDILDAASLGTDPSLVAATFKAEAQQIVDSASLVGDAFASFKTQFPELASVVHEFTASAVTDSKALRDAQNSAAKNLTDFLANLQSGQGSTQSPLNTLASAQTLYQANLPLAQSGNVDAQNKFVSLADNLEKAARVVYASGQGYQDIKNQIINQGLNLPAMQATTDPVTQAVRDAITAIQIGNAAITAGNFSNENLNGAIIGGIGTTINSLNNGILPAVNAGNAAAVATSLATYFNQIDPSGKLLDIAARTLTAANNSNSLPGVATNTANTKAAVDSNNAKTDTSNTTLDAIKGLQATASQNLVLMQAALAPGNTAVSIAARNASGVLTGGPSQTVSNLMVEALNKIVVNTYMTALNTNLIPHQEGGGIGVLATGGLVTGPGTGTSDSIHKMLSNREFVIQNAAVEKFGVGFFEQLNAGIMPRAIGNDNLRPINVAPVIRGGGGNADLIAAIARLEARLDRIEGNTGRTVNAVVGGSNLVAKTVDKSGKDTVEATKSSGVALRAEMRMRRRNQRDAA
jgi:hypothetical protein